MEYTGPVRITDIQRANNSKDGNPRFRVTFSDLGTIITKSDASINFRIDNPEFRDGEVMVALDGKGATRTVKHVVTVWTEADAAELRDLGKYMSGSKEIGRWRVLCAKRDAAKKLDD